MSWRRSAKRAAYNFCTHISTLVHVHSSQDKSTQLGSLTADARMHTLSDKVYIPTHTHVCVPYTLAYAQCRNSELSFLNDPPKRGIGRSRGQVQFKHSQYAAVSLFTFTSDKGLFQMDPLQLKLCPRIPRLCSALLRRCRLTFQNCRPEVPGLAPVSLFFSVLPLGAHVTLPHPSCYVPYVVRFVCVPV